MGEVPLEDSEKAKITELVDKFNAAKPVLQKVLSVLDTDEAEKRIVRNIDRFLGALIHTAAGLVVTATAISGAVIVSLSRANITEVARQFSSDLLMDMAWIIGAALAATIVFQCGRLFINHKRIKRPVVAGIIGGGLLVLLAVPVIQGVKTGICGGAVISAYQFSQTRIPAPTEQDLKATRKPTFEEIRTETSGRLPVMFSANCDDEIKDWLP